MYNKYFGLEETPFSIAPDPRYLYMSDQHREALAHLIYGFNSTGGFVLLTGDVGTGKTTICRCLLDQIPVNSAIAFIFNPKLTVEELLATICDEFGIAYDKDNSSIKKFVDLINAFLLQTHSDGVKAVLIIDEAQNLSTDVLEQLRLLTNLETNQYKLLHVILLGQPELALKLSEQGLSQLSQRIIARYHLGPLSKTDVRAYVNHRLNVAGINKQLFTNSAINKLYSFTGGVPRLINVICDRALLGTFTKEQDRVSRSTLAKAAHEVFGDKKEQQKNTSRTAVAWTLMILVLIAFGIAIASNYFRVRPTPVMITDEIQPEPAAPPIPDNLNWADMGEMNESGSLSYNTMFNLWNIDFAAEKTADACSIANENGLQCMQGLRSMNSLRNINRPVVLKLHDNNGNIFFITLITLDDNTANISFGNEKRTVAIKDIKARWLGDYTLLWRPPHGYTGTIRSAYKGPVVKWLRTNLALINQTPLIEPINEIYDSDLEQQVKKFQIAEGLIPDGVVGPQTMVHINTIIDSSVPTLIDINEKS